MLCGRSASSNARFMLEGIDAGHFFDEELGCDAERPVCVERYAWVSTGFLERSVRRMLLSDILTAGRSFACMSP